MSGIYQLSKASTGAENSTVQQPSPNLNINDDSLLDADESDTFDLRNQNYQLRSRINNLEYEKSKESMSYENTIKELKKKYAILEKLVSETSEKEDINADHYQQLLNKCQFLAEENEQLKKQMQINIEKNRITPNFNAPEMAEDLAALAFLQKPENIIQLEKAYELAHKQEFDNLKDKLAQLEKESQKKEKEVLRLEKENEKLKEQLARVEVEKEESIRIMTKQTEEHYNNLVKFKDKTIEDLKQEQISLSLQLTESKKIIGQLSSSQTDVNQQQKNIKLLATQLREKQSKIVELQEQVNRLQIERTRVRSQKQKIEQQARYYENEKKEVEAKRKMLQQQLYKKENEYTQAKNSWFNEKIQIKKQFNSSKYQVEEEVNHFKNVIDAKEQENKRLRESLIAIHEENQELKQKGEGYAKKIDKMNLQILSLNSNIEKLIAQNQVNYNALKSKQKALDMSQYERQIQALKQEMGRSKDQNIRSSVRLSEASKQQIKLEEELKHKEEMIQLLKIEMEERIAKEKNLDTKIKEAETKSQEKEKVIHRLEDEIKNIKFDNRQLQIANQELREKVQTLNKIKVDIEHMNAQLKREKMHLSQKKKEEKNKTEVSSPKFAFQHKQSKAFSISSSPKNAEPIDLFELADNHLNKLPTLSDKQSDEGKETILDLIKQLKAENNELQTRIGEVEHQLDKKAVDLNVKQEELKALKSTDHYRPKEVNLDPFIQTSKRNQFNAIFFQNKISELQKQIQSIKAIKQKELEQQKKMLRRQMQQKYLTEMKKQSTYIHELEKQSNLLNSRHEESHKAIVSLKIKIDELQQQKYDLEVELSSNLEELNTILRKCKAYQNKLIEMESVPKVSNAVNEQYRKIKTSYDYIIEKYETQSLMLKNANEQIRKLNDVLMLKESQLKSMSSRSSHRGISPNSSLPGGKEEGQGFEEHQKSSEEDLLRVWGQRRQGPSFSRI